MLHCTHIELLINNNNYVHIICDFFKSNMENKLFKVILLLLNTNYFNNSFTSNSLLVLL